MDVIRSLGAELWKMFVADLFLTLGALGTVLGLGLLLRLGVIAQDQAPYALAAVILVVLSAAVGFSVVRETKKKVR